LSTDPYTALATAFREQAWSKTKEALSGTAAELGTITSSGLKLDHFKHEIGDYFVAEFPGTLKLPELKWTGGVTEKKERFVFDPSETEETVLKPVYKPGDRVLVIPLNGGHDAVVLCKVVSAGG